MLDVPELEGVGVPRAYTARHWPLIRCNPLALAAHMLMSAGVLYLILGAHARPSAFFELQSRTLDLLNETLARGDYRDETLLAIVSLSNNEALSGTLEGLKAHQAGLKHMVACRGGLNELAPYTKRIIVFSDRSSALTFGIPRSFPQHPDGEVFQKHAPTFAASLRLKRGLQALVDAETLNSDTVPRLLQFQSIFEKLRAAYGTSRWNESVSRHEWIVTESKLDVVTLGSFLTFMSHYFNRYAVNLDAVKPYDFVDMVRIATLTLFYLLRQRCLSKLDRSSFVEDAVTSISQHISPATLRLNFDSWFSETEGRALWWIYSVAVFASPAPPQNLRDLLLILQEKLHVVSESQSMTILGEIFFCPMMLGHDHARVWSWLINGGRSRPVVRL